MVPRADASFPAGWARAGARLTTLRGAGGPPEASGVDATGPTLEASAPKGAPIADGDEPELTSDDPWVGRVVAEKYRIVGRLGEGGMAVVYEAENVTIKKRVALKLVDTSGAIGQELAARFGREMEASAGVEHPHVVAAFDGGTLPTGEAFLVSQLVRGDSLLERLGRGPIPWREACTIAGQLADALSAIHAAGYVHRDLTPSNVLLTVGGSGGVHVFVLDLGIAAPIDREKASAAFQTTIGASIGTLGYMSPEQAIAKPVGPRSDLYTLGLLFFEMLTARPVVDSDLERGVITRQQLEEKLALPPIAETGIPAELDAFVRQLLGVEPTTRPESASLVRDAFVRFASAEGSLAPAPASTEAAPKIGATRVHDVVSASAVKRPPPSATPSVPRRAPGFVERVQRGETTASDRVLVLVAVALVFASVVAGGFFAFGRGDGADAEPVAAPAPAAPEAPVALSPVEEALLHGSTRAIRDEAASTVLAAPDATYPRYARLVAVLLLARSCEARLTQIEALGALGDARALPALERIDGAPRSGCGRRSREDCYGCARSAIDAAIAALEPGPGAAP